VDVDLLGSREAIDGARVEKLAGAAMLGVIADIFDNSATFLVTSLSTTNVCSVVSLLVKSAGLRNAVAMPLIPQPLPSSRDQGNCR
jgi:hypothetical protein